MGPLEPSGTSCVQHRAGPASPHRGGPAAAPCQCLIIGSCHVPQEYMLNKHLVSWENSLTGSVLLCLIFREFPALFWTAGVKKSIGHLMYTVQQVPVHGGGWCMSSVHCFFCFPYRKRPVPVAGLGYRCTIFEKALLRSGAEGLRSNIWLKNKKQPPQQLSLSLMWL